MEHITREQYMIQRLLEENSQLKANLTSLEFDYKLLEQQNKSLEAENSKLKESVGEVSEENKGK